MKNQGAYFYDNIIKDLVLEIADIFKFKGRIIFDITEPDGQIRKPIDNSVIKRLYPELGFTPLKDGLRLKFEWFFSNYKKARK